MTMRLRPALWTLLLLPCLAGPLSAPAHAADDADLPPLPPGVVAIVKAGPSDTQGVHLTFDGFCLSAGQQSLADLKRQRSGPRAVLEQLIEELMVRQEAKRLGIVVTDEDVDKRWRDWDNQLRVKSNGAVTLEDELEKQGTTDAEFRAQVAHMLRKERIAADMHWLGKQMPANDSARLRQISIVIATLRDKTPVQYGVLLVENVQQHTKPAKLAPGVVATVRGVPITMAEYGRALVIRLPASKVREYLDRECKTALMTLKGIGLDDAQLQQEIQHLEKLWPLERELQRDEVWRTVSFKDRFETQFSMTMADVKQSRYARGLLGLVRKMREEVTNADVEKEYQKQRKGRYGPYLVVQDISIGFAQKEGFSTGGRTLVQARHIANGFARRLAEGISFDKLSAEVNARRDRTMQAARIHLVKTDEDLVLYEQAARMRDGDVSTPFETLAEVHVMKRIGARPARTLAEVAPHAREMLARRRAKQWIEDKLRDPDWVRLRWPLPQRR